MNFKSENGNVLVYILIAVALFAALGFAVSSMMRGSGSGIAEEKMVVFAAEILGYSKNLRDMVHFLRISNGCDESEISFERSPFDGSDTDYINPNAPGDFSCHLFHPSGGGVAYQTGPKKANIVQEWIFTGANDGENIGTSCDSDSCSDLIAILPDLSRSLCKKINETLDIARDNDFITQENNNFQIDEFQGVYSYEARLSDSASLDALDGKAQGCVRGNSSPQNPNTYYFYQILLAR